MNSVVANESDLYFERGGPMHRFVHRICGFRADDPASHKRVILFLLLTWFPLLLVALAEGRAFGPSPRESFLLDFVSYARFFLAVPILIVAEVVIGPRLSTAGLHFIRGGFVQPDDYPAFEQAIVRVVKWRESLWAEIAIVGFAFAGAWTLTTETIYGGGEVSWHTVSKSSDTGLRVSFTGLWYHNVAVPIMQFLWYRWLWRIVIWTRFMWTISRLKLDVVATHADQAGGLGFLGNAHSSFGLLAFGLSSVLSAEVAFRIVYESAQIETFKASYVVMLAIVQLQFLGPLLIFTPLLSRRRLTWLREYSLLVVKYNRAFHEKWILGKPPAAEPLLGSADIQSLADLGGSFEYIRKMSLVPFNLRVILQMAVMTSLPCLPLLLLVMPVAKILDLIAGAVF